MVCGNDKTYKKWCIFSVFTGIIIIETIISVANSNGYGSYNMSLN